MNKILSVAVPAYNSEKYLEKCLSSFEHTAVLDKLEIIVVNDGSTDATGAIAERFSQKHPESFYVIHKENGGHGSGINAAERMANGKYFRVVDSDDWVITENLPRYVKQLEELQADVVVTGFHRVDMATMNRMPSAVPQRLCQGVMDMAQVMAHYDEIRNCLTIHGIAYRLDIYRASGILLSEKIFYEDIEYITMPFCRVSTVACLDMFLYQYLVGNVQQSTSAQNRVKNQKHGAHVIKEMLAFRSEQHGFSQAALQHYDAKLSDMVIYYYMDCLIHNTDRKRGYSDMQKMRVFIETEASFLLPRLGSRLMKLMIMHRLHVSSRMLNGIFDSRLYDIFRKILRK